MSQLSPRGLAPAFAVIALLLHAACLGAALAAEAMPPAPVPAPAIAMHGDPALKDAFDHLPYADPAAVKGGRLAIGFLGTFDSLNPFNLKAGSTAQGMNGNVFETLMTRSLDEPFTLYGLIAQSIETGADRTSVTFRLDPRAHFSDGEPITSADVRFTFDLLKTKGRPQQRAAYSLIKSIETPDDIEYFRDANSLFEAFSAGLLDFREETNPARWTNAYDFPAIRDHRMIREALPAGGPKGLEGFVFNLRRPLFENIRVREALGLLFDFEWINANLYNGLYKRTKSFFDDSELASTGRPADAAELALLAPFPGAVREDILEGRWRPAATDGSGADRIEPKRALALLKEAGYDIEGGRLTKGGEALSFEIMVKDRNQERLALNYADSLGRIGVAAKVRLVDEVQYQRRRQKFDFDMMIGSWLASASPGNEQRSRWGSASAEQEASFNLAGVKSPAIDAMINVLLSAKTHEDFVAAVRAYDRLLLSGFYVVPLFHSPDQWIAASAKLARPKSLPRYGPASGGATLDTWWRAQP